MILIDALHIGPGRGFNQANQQRVKNYARKYQYNNE
jgi:hypothetical protein